MNRSLIIISMFFVAALWVPSTASAATVCNSIDTKRAYVCIEDRHSNVVVGQKEWHWSVTPNKGEFSPVPGAEDLMYTKIYTCENEDRYTAKIEVRYRFPE